MKVCKQIVGNPYKSICPKRHPTHYTYITWNNPIEFLYLCIYNIYIYTSTASNNSSKHLRYYIQITMRHKVFVILYSLDRIVATTLILNGGGGSGGGGDIGDGISFTGIAFLAIQTVYPPPLIQRVLLNINSLHIDFVIGLYCDTPCIRNVYISNSKDSFGKVARSVSILLSLSVVFRCWLLRLPPPHRIPCLIMSLILSKKISLNTHTILYVCGTKINKKTKSFCRI